MARLPQPRPQTQRSRKPPTMADPKYANLPGIAHDQPDVYETGDMPESDQHLDDGFDDTTSDVVETLHITANEAFGKFKGKQLDASNVDFSDRLKPGKKNRKGYVAWSGDLEIVNRGGDGDLIETPLQKYQRLKLELGELQEELLTLDNESKGKGKKKGGEADGGDLAAVATKVSSLQDELGKLRLEETLGSQLLRDIQDPTGAANAKLLSQLEELKRSRDAGGKKKGGAAGGPSGDSGGAVYELFMAPEAAKLEQHERVAQLDRRLEALEKALGADQAVMSSLSLETGQKSVSGAISVLDARTALLEPAHLDRIEGRLAILQQKMNDVATKKEVLDDHEKQSRIGALYDLVQKTEGMSAAVPEIVDRLDALQDLHGKALHFNQALTQLDAVQQRIQDGLHSSKGLLEDTRKQMGDNLERMNANLQAIDQRIKKL